MVAALPKPKSDGYDFYSKAALQWAGKMREFALKGADPALTTTQTRPLDQQVVNAGDAAKEHFMKGINDFRRQYDLLGIEISKASEPGRKASLARERKRLTYYTSFDFDLAALRVDTGLDE